MNTMSCEKHLGMGTVQNCAPCLQVELDYVRSEIEALRADVVWAVMHCAKAESVERAIWFETDSSRMTRWGIPVTSIEYDSTPDDLRRVIREARKGE